VVISIHDGFTNENTKPDIVIDMLAMGLLGLAALPFEKGFIAESMRRTGFKSVLSKTIETPMGIMDVDIGRK
jgi:hypothetical protein